MLNNPALSHTTAKFAVRLRDAIQDRGPEALESLPDEYIRQLLADILVAYIDGDDMRWRLYRAVHSMALTAQEQAYETEAV
jgi:hypothetical protein